jgi:prevent-host-death family protein
MPRPFTVVHLPMDIWTDTLGRMTERTISASEFKQRCLALLDRVASSSDTFVVTKRGVPVARLVPLANDDEPAGRALEGSVTYNVSDDELLFSTGEAWDAER